MLIVIKVEDITDAPLLPNLRSPSLHLTNKMEWPGSLKTKHFTVTALWGSSHGKLSSSPGKPAPSPTSPLLTVSWPTLQIPTLGLGVQLWKEPGLRAHPSALGTGMQEDQKAKVLWYRQSLRPPTSLVTVSQRHPWADLQSLYVWFPLPRLASLSLLPWPHFWLFLTAPVSNPKFLQVFALTPSRVSHWPKLVTGEFKETWKNKPWSLLGESSVHSIEQGYMCVCADKRLVLCREYSLVSYCAISFVGFCCF